MPALCFYAHGSGCGLLEYYNWRNSSHSLFTLDTCFEELNLPVKHQLNFLS